MIKSVQAQIDELKKLYKNCLCNCFKGTIHIVSEEEFDEESPLEGWEPPENPREGVTVIVEFTDGTIAYYSYFGDWVYDFSISGGSNSETIISLTYSDLTTLISADGLVQGQQYLINDYRTVHTILGTSDTNIGDLEPIIVTAISVNDIAPIAFSTVYTDDILYYHIGIDETNFPGATYGYISRRIDTIQNNDIGTDWRACKYRRYKIDETNWNAATTYNKAQVAKRATGTSVEQKEIYISIKDGNTNHAVTDTNWWRRFEWDNESYAGLTPEGWYIVGDAFALVINTTTDYQDKLLFTYNTNIYNNEIKTYRLLNVTVGDGFYSNSIGNDFYGNSIGNDFYGNSIGNYFTNNSIGNNFNSNSIGNDFYGNSIGNYFYGNSIGNYFYGNSIGNYFTNNSIGNNFNSNSIGNYFYGNSIGNGFYSNSIGNYFNNNSIGNYFFTGVVGNNFQWNTISIEWDSFNENSFSNKIISSGEDYRLLDDSNELEPNKSYYDLNGSGRCILVVGNAEAYADFLFTTSGVITLLSNSANIFTTLQTGTNHVIIKDNGSNVRIVNEMGNQLGFSMKILRT